VDTQSQTGPIKFGTFSGVFLPNVLTILGVIMFLKTITHVPETVTGLIGAGFIGWAFWSSVLYRRRHPPEREPIGNAAEG